jgi:Domain of unknown function (DUF4276)
MSVPTVTIASIVEGDGEVRALPKLLFRLALQHSVTDLRVPPPPMRVPRGKLLAKGEIERAVSAAAQRVGASGGILVLLDADDDCPAKFGPLLLKRAQAARSDKRLCVVLANREFETWFVASAESLAGNHGFPADLTAPDDPERIRGAKEWLTSHKMDGHPYKPTVDQAPLASIFDMEQARSGSPSFDKFCREARSLLGAGLI